MPSSEIENPHKLASPYEFFIVQKKDGAYHLDGNYTVFGKVIKGMSVVDIIANLETDKSVFFGDFKNLNALIVTHDKDHFNSSKDYSKFSELKFVKKINLSNSDCKPELSLGSYHGITLTSCYAETELKNNNIKNYLESLF